MDLNTYFAICDQGDYSLSTSKTNFAVMVLDKLLKTGLYTNSDIYVYTRLNMSEGGSQALFTPFANAGAKLVIITPLLSSAKYTPVSATVKVLEYLSMNYVNDSTIELDRKHVPFTSANFLRLIQLTTVSYIPDDSNEGEAFTIAFNRDGFLRKIEFFIYRIKPGGFVEFFRGSYDEELDFLELPDNFYKTSVVTLIGFQDIIFLPSIEHEQFSTAKQMIDEIFRSELLYSFKFVYVEHDPDIPIQRVVENTLNDSMTEMSMSAFPMFLKLGTDLRHSETVLYDGIVMINGKTPSRPALFQLFQSVSGFIWLCVLVSAIFVAVIFYIIKCVNDKQSKAMGLLPQDHNVRPVKRFISVIFRTFSAVLLAKVLIKPKRISVGVLYQSCWLASIFLIATYAASLAEQRFVGHSTTVPFSSIEGLLANSYGYRWFFLTNSSVLYMIEQSEDHVLKKLLNTAQSKWENEMYCNSVVEAAKRIVDNDFDILIVSQLEAKRILSVECKLERIGATQYLFPLAFLFSGPDHFVKLMQKRINVISNNRILDSVAQRTLGLGDCPLTSEGINVQANTLSIKEMSGIFFIVLVGIASSFIVAGIEFVVQKYPMYRQWRRVNIPSKISTYICFSSYYIGLCISEE
nr:glutamate receptor 4 [Hymenolepis microstoma]